MQIATRIVLIIATIATASNAGEISPDCIQRLDQYLADEVSRFHLPGLAIAVVEGDQIIHTNFWGDDVQQESAFLIGSCSKTITALAALLAFADADVDLDTPIDTLLTKLTIRGEVASPTLRQLLQHRSGLTRAQGFQSLPSLAEVEDYGLTLDLKFAPGERYNYSNRNYALLGLLMEKVSRQSFCEFVEERVFQPAGMTHSFCGSIPSENVAPEHQYCFGFARRVAPTIADAS